MTSQTSRNGAERRGSLFKINVLNAISVQSISSISSLELVTQSHSFLTFIGLIILCCWQLIRAGLRHVEGVRQNRAANFRGPQFWTIKILYKLTCQFERLRCLDYGANTDINDFE